jgi:hypothetical protein
MRSMSTQEMEDTIAGWSWRQIGQIVGFVAVMLLTGYVLSEMD